MSTTTTKKYKDAAEDRLASATSKQRNALNHFQAFLEGYLPQIGEDVVEVEDVPYDGLGLPRRPSSRDTNEFWSKLMGCFVDYLDSATYYRDPNKKLALSSADGFFSSMKEYFTTKWRNDPSLNVFQDAQWGKLRDKLKGKFRESNRGKPRKKKPSSTREDREALAKAAFWQDTATASEFLHLLNSTLSFSARGSEVALVAAATTSAVETTESVYRYQLLQVECKRQKGNPYQEIRIYPDADGVLEDWYFSLIYMLVMSGCDSDYMFRRYSVAALSTVDGKSKSTVPALWKSDFDELLESLDEMNLPVNKALRSHCNKRGSQQLCAETPSASGLSQYFRAGWQGAANTMLKYIAGSVTLERPAAKAIAKWPTRDGCGQPVTSTTS